MNFELTKKALEENGYEMDVVIKGDGVRNWKKRIGRNDFPRLHIRIDADKEWDIHIDKKKNHGFFSKWLGKSKSKNIINNSRRIKEEILNLRCDVYMEVLDDVRRKIINIKKNYAK